MDGFYVAKFKVSRLSKKARQEQESEVSPEDDVEEPFVPLPTSVEEEEKAIEQAEQVRKEAESVKFDDEEDKKIIERSLGFLFFFSVVDQNCVLILFCFVLNSAVG